MCKNGYRLLADFTCQSFNDNSEIPESSTDFYNKTFNLTHIYFTQAKKYLFTSIITLCKTLNVNIGTLANCSECITGYYPGKNGDCMEIPDGCIEMNTTTPTSPYCIECLADYTYVLQINETFVSNCWSKSILTSEWNISSAYIDGCI